MENPEITIFYSWQSDLPGGQTRGLIQESIKDAVKLLRDTVDIEADRDTQGQFGSPDIAQTIFSKIDSCDIFIADISAICQYPVVVKEGKPTGKVKLMPNPNVMIELGYATQVIGWENVICILNVDYGELENMPFDIVNRRLTPYSLKGGQSKGNVKKHLRGIIQESVENILQNGKRVKSGFSHLKVGCYQSGEMVTEILPLEIAQSLTFTEHRQKVIAECVKLLHEIREIKIDDGEDFLPEQTMESGNVSREIVGTQEWMTPVGVPSIVGFDLFKATAVEIKDEDKLSTIKLCQQYLGEDLSGESDFFDIGALKRKAEFGINTTYHYEGTEEEKNKYDKIEELQFRLNRLELWDWYVTTFDNMVCVSLAVSNISSVFDEDVDIYVKIQPEDANVILPSKDLINPEMSGLEGIIVEKEILGELFQMFVSSDINYDEDISYTIEDAHAAIGAQFTTAGINGNPRYDEDDYERELLKYIAQPISTDDSVFLFTLQSLRANEKKWLGPTILLKPLTDEFEITYFIKSKYSDGTLSGRLKYKK